jgi:hypothetical protein
MAVIGGAPLSVTIWGRRFSITADNSTSRRLGGVSNEVQENSDGTTRKIETRKSWKYDSLQVVIDDDNGDQEYLQSVADSKEYGAISLEYPSGRIYQGVGTITDEIMMEAGSTTATISLAGDGVLTPQ